MFYGWRALAGYFSLATNAYDLSVLDYAVWNAFGRPPGFVPFIGHSIFSHHSMPILWLLAPFYALFQSPLVLIVFQVCATAAAGGLFYRFQARLGLDRAIALMLLVVFLMSRRTHSAAVSFFYPECLQAALAFAVVASSRSAGTWYLTWAALLLATKEDAAVYLAAFGGIQFFVPGMNRIRALATIAVSVTWAAASFGLLIPMSRAHDGLTAGSSLIVSRFASDEGAFDAVALVARTISVDGLSRLVTLLVPTGFLAVVGWEWLAVALPGVIINMAAQPGTQQASLIGHYFWPVLPWLFMASAVGALRLQRRSLRVARVWAAVLMCAALLDNPALRRWGTNRVDPAATTVLRQLDAISYGSGDVVLAQTSVIPHLDHSNNVFAVGGEKVPPRRPDLVLVTKVGNPWPLDQGDVDAVIRAYAANTTYQQISSGPLYVFRVMPPR